MIALVYDWVLKHHVALRSELNLPDSVTYDFDVTVVDTEGDDDARASRVVYAYPEEPDDADGDWEYRGCYNSVEYRVCGSIEGGDAWWLIDDCSDLGGRGGVRERTYTQDTELLHKELQPRFRIEIDGKDVGAVEVCSWEGVADLDDIKDADDMLEAVKTYIELGYVDGEASQEFFIEVWSRGYDDYDDNDDGDYARGWAELGEIEDDEDEEVEA